MIKKLLEFKNIIVAVLFLMGAGGWFVTTNATMDDVIVVAMRLDQKITHDQVINLMDKIDRYEEKHQCIDTEGCRIQMDSAQFELYEIWLQRLFCLENPETKRCFK